MHTNNSDQKQETTAIIITEKGFRKQEKQDPSLIQMILILESFNFGFHSGKNLQKQATREYTLHEHFCTHCVPLTNLKPNLHCALTLILDFPLVSLPQRPKCDLTLTKISSTSISLAHVCVCIGERGQESKRKRASHLVNPFPEKKNHGKKKEGLSWGRIFSLDVCLSVRRVTAGRQPSLRRRTPASAG